MIKVQSAYFPERESKTNNETQWLQMLEAKRREYHFGTHHKIKV